MEFPRVQVTSNVGPYDCHITLIGSLLQLLGQENPLLIYTYLYVYVYVVTRPHCTYSNLH